MAGAANTRGAMTGPATTRGTTTLRKPMLGRTTGANTGRTNGGATGTNGARIPRPPNGPARKICALAESQMVIEHAKAITTKNCFVLEIMMFLVFPLKTSIEFRFRSPRNHPLSVTDPASTDDNLDGASCLSPLYFPSQASCLPVTAPIWAFI